MALAAGAYAWMGAFGTQTATAMADTTGADSACPDDLPPLPPAEPDPNDQFGVDKNINMTTIDEWLGRPDVVYRDMRLIFDPARWEDIDEDPYASTVLPGFKMVPYPYLATMAPIPVTEYYEDETLFTCKWSEEGELLSVKSNYKESLNILRELFPKDKPIFLCCGGASSCCCIWAGTRSSCTTWAACGTTRATRQSTLSSTAAAQTRTCTPLGAPTTPSSTSRSCAPSR